MYVNNLISLQENISTYGIDNGKVTGHVTLSSPGMIKCYVQNLKPSSSNNGYVFCVFSKHHNKGIKIGKLGTQKETKWLVDEKNILGSGIKLEEIDGVALVAEHEMRGVEAIAVGFSKDRYMLLSLVDHLFPRNEQKTTSQTIPKGTTSKVLESVEKPKVTMQAEKPIAVAKETMQAEKPMVVAKETMQVEKPMVVAKETMQAEKPMVVAKETMQVEKPMVLEKETESVENPKVVEQGPGPVILPKTIGASEQNCVVLHHEEEHKYKEMPCEYEEEHKYKEMPCDHEEEHKHKEMPCEYEKGYEHPKMPCESKEDPQQSICKSICPKPRVEGQEDFILPKGATVGELAQEESELPINEELKRIIDSISKDKRVEEKARELEKRISKMSGIPQSQKLFDKSQLQQTLESRYMSQKINFEELLEEVEEDDLDTNPKKALDCINQMNLEETALDEEAIEEKDYLKEIDKRLQAIRARMNETIDKQEIE